VIETVNVTKIKRVGKTKKMRLQIRRRVPFGIGILDKFVRRNGSGALMRESLFLIGKSQMIHHMITILSTIIGITLEYDISKLPSFL